MANRPMKRCSTTLITREVQIKFIVINLSYPLGWLLLKKKITQEVVIVGEDVEALEPCALSGQLINGQGMTQSENHYLAITT